MKRTRDGKGGKDRERESWREGQRVSKKIRKEKQSSMEKRWIGGEMERMRDGKK